MEVVFTREAIVDVLRSTIPDVEWLLGEIESEHGWLRFPPWLNEAIKNLKLETYPLLYASENHIAAMLFLGWMSKEELAELGRELKAATAVEQSEWLGAFMEELQGDIDRLEIPKTVEERTKAVKLFAALSPEEQAQATRRAQHFWGSFLPSFYQTLSMMVHGEKLTSLVAQAKTGNDDAFVRAVQIDKNIGLVDPYFKERISRAQLEADSNFWDKLSYRQRTPPYRGKIRHKSLWLAFSILDSTGHLVTLNHSEILDICDEAGVGGMNNRIQSVKHLSSRLREYRQFQKRGIASTT